MTDDELKQLDELESMEMDADDPLRLVIAIARREAKRADELSSVLGNTAPQPLYVELRSERDAARALCREAAEAIRALYQRPDTLASLLWRLDEVNR